MNILSLENVSKTFGIKPLFSAITFGLDEADKIGVIGANGSGKSTLLRVIAGEEATDTGRVVLSNERVIAYLSQNPPYDPAQTVSEAVFSGNNAALREKLDLLRDYETACGALAEAGGPEKSEDEKLLARVSELAHKLDTSGAWQLETEAKTILAQLGISQLNAKMNTLSGGQRKRVAIAHSLIIKPDLLILDEPTNHLDAETVEWLERYLRDFKGALLLVTHDRYFLDRVTNRILEIERGRVQSFSGGYAYYLEKKQEQEERQVVETQRLKQMARRELEWLRRGAKARTRKSQARIDNANEVIQKSREAASAIAEKKSLDIAFDAQRLGGKILTLDGISKRFGDKQIVSNFSYQFKRGDRIGVIGANGSGKTTLLEIIAGRLQPDTGKVEKGQTVVIGYYDQESRDLPGEQRLIDYVKEVAERIQTSDGDWITASQMLERFLFAPAMQYQPIATLSGGERRRLYLLRLLMRAPNILLLDEITNDLDIATLIALEDYLETFPGCLVVVSHDRYFLDRTIEYLFRFEGEGRIREYPGDYSTFIEIRDRERAEAALQAGAVKAAAAAAKAPVEKPAADASGKRKLTFKERRELEELEARIPAQEARKAEIEQLLDAHASDHVLVAQLYEELQTLNTALDADVERWAALAELV
ncbi:MAG: ABC-F family ATP-binding cassette domain-containing protein [Acidobacteria bacterium]|nr:ABC-F family ATP-binding cassette domain-containing protein [Acidobacteriota bacterium]MBI3425784.1 ABC-F family ATP-binding cassette domain-containing protein [Acidobacteriota bacterium]